MVFDRFITKQRVFHVDVSHPIDEFIGEVQHRCRIQRAPLRATVLVLLRTAAQQVYLGTK